MTLPFISKRNTAWIGLSLILILPISCENESTDEKNPDDGVDGGDTETTTDGSLGPSGIITVSIDDPTPIGEMAFGHPIGVEAGCSRRMSYRMQLHDLHGLFERGFLTVPVDGRPMRVICPKCGRYAYGTPENWTCACP